MLRTAGILAVVFASAACTVDSVEEGGVVRNDMIGRVCTMEMSVTGSFVRSKAPPVHEDGTPYTGCWPIGTWTFTVAKIDSDCATTPTPLPQYQFKVDEAFDADGLPYQVNTYLTDPSVRNRVKVSQGGSGLCEGELNLFSNDGKEVWIIKPAMFENLSLGGDGEYSLHKDDQWIGD